MYQCMMKHGEYGCTVLTCPIRHHHQEGHQNPPSRHSKVLLKGDLDLILLRLMTKLL